MQKLVLDELLLFLRVRMDEMGLVQDRPAGTGPNERDERLHAPSRIRSRARSENPKIASRAVEKRHQETVEVEELLHLVGERVEDFLDLQTAADDAGDIIQDLDLLRLARRPLKEHGVLRGHSDLDTNRGEQLEIEHWE